MLYEECPAPPGLKPFITGFWLVRARPKARYEKILPGPSAHLVLNLSDPYRLIDPDGSSPGGSDASAGAEVSTGFYSGLQRRFLISENPAQLFNVGAVFSPFGVAAFTAQPPSALNAKVVDADRIFPGFSALRSELLRGGESPTPEHAFAALESFLTARLRPGHRSPVRRQIRSRRRASCRRGHTGSGAVEEVGRERVHPGADRDA